MENPEFYEFQLHRNFMLASYNFQTDLVVDSADKIGEFTTAATALILVL